LARAIFVQQGEVGAVKIAAAARKLAMKNLHDKNRNLLQLHSVSKISSSDGWADKSIKIN
jgi:hypothetical protein